MRIPPQLSDLLSKSFRASELVPADAIKQLSQLVGQPNIVQAFKDAANKLGWKENWSPSTIQDVLQKTGRWMESVTHPWLNRALASSHSGINATGELFSSRWASHTLSTNALAANTKLAGSYVDSTHIDLQLNRLLIGLTGAQQAIVLPSLSIAITVISQASKTNTEWILPRTDCIRLPGNGGNVGGNLRNILDHSGVRVSEIGSNSDCSQKDFAESLSHSNQCLMLASPSSNIEHANEQRAYGISAAKSANAKVCELWIDGSLHDLEYGDVRFEALSHRLSAGADLVVVPGSGLIGGPECAIVLGSLEVMAPIVALVTSLGWFADGVTRGTLLQTIEGTQTPVQWNESHIGQVLSTSADNLRNRATRLATQLSGSSLLTAATVAEKSIRLGAGPWSSRRLPSSVVQLYPKDKSPSELSEELQGRELPIWGNVQSDHVELVMRTIEPDEDRLIVQEFCDRDEKVQGTDG